MAYLELKENARKGYFFNVSRSVGANAANYWTDIMLVQYFIRNNYEWSWISGSVILSYLANVDLPDPNTDLESREKGFRL